MIAQTMSMPNGSETGSEMGSEITSGMGLLNEKPLHASLNQWYAQPGDWFEVAVDGFVIDIVRDRQL